MSELPRITKKTTDFLKKAGSQKSLVWLKKEKRSHEELLIGPVRELAFYLADTVGRDLLAKGYKFPRRGFGRLRRPAHKIEKGQPAYRDFVHFQVTRPSKSIFDVNPTLYFYLSPESAFAGGGLYLPSSRQIKSLRAWIAEDPPELKKLLKSKNFVEEFPRGLETDKSLKTYPRSYSPDHPQIQRLKLQAYYVKRDFTKRELYSSDFAETLADSWRQCLRLNELLYDVINDESYVAPIAPAMDEPVEVDEPASREELWDDRL